MRIVLLHGWLRGNLGDLCIAHQLVRFLRARFPQAHLTVVSEPRGEWTVPEELLAATDAYVERPFREAVDDLLGDASAVVQIPGGGLQDPGDSRGPYMLRDAELCHRLGVRHVLAGHSFHPSLDLGPLRGSVVIAREPASHALLHSRGIPSLLSADPAFLQPVPEAAAVRAGTLLFLRRRHFESIALDGEAVVTDGMRTVIPALPLTLASSDPLRDDKVLQPLATRHDLPYERCLDLLHLLRIIAGSAHVVSDRYHPVIFAAMLETPFTFLQREGSLRDHGLRDLLAGHTPVALAALARAGFTSVAAALDGALP
jgi:polysaccharide pyruvyl transferase WcaK-like protein